MTDTKLFSDIRDALIEQGYRFTTLEVPGMINIRHGDLSFDWNADADMWEVDIDDLRNHCGGVASSDVSTKCTDVPFIVARLIAVMDKCALEPEPGDKNTLDVMDDAIRILRDRGVSATLEYPGYIAVPVGDRYACFGTANGDYDANWEDYSGGTFDEPIDFHLPRTATVEQLVDAVEAVLKNIGKMNHYEHCVSLGKSTDDCLVVHNGGPSECPNCGWGKELK